MPILAKFTLLVASCLVVGGCSVKVKNREVQKTAPPISRAHPVFESRAWQPEQAPLPEPPFHPGFDFQRQGPLEWLTYLKAIEVGTAKDASGGSGKRWFGETVWGTHRGWILASDIPTLLAFLDDATPCAGVQKELSSFGPGPTSTIGREASFLIEGFRSEIDRTTYCGYPPTLTSRHLHEPDPAALRAWWSGCKANLDSGN